MKSGFAFVYLEDERDAEDASHGLDSTPFGYDRRRLSVDWSRQDIGQVVFVEYALRDDNEREDRYVSPRRGYDRYGGIPSSPAHRRVDQILNMGGLSDQYMNNGPSYDRHRSP